MSAGLEGLRRRYESDPADDSAARDLAQTLARAGALEDALFLLRDRVDESDAQLTELGAAIAAPQRPVIESLREGFYLARRAPGELTEDAWDWASPEAFLAGERGPVLGLRVPHGAEAADLEAACALSTLVGLSLNYSGAGVVDVAKLRGFSRLRYLNLAKTEGGEDWLPSIGALSSLEALNCRDLPVTGAVLAAWSGLKKLRWLDLTNTHLEAGDLAHLKVFKDLEALELCSTSADLGELPPLTRLRSLNLINNDMVDADAYALGRLSNLEELNLGHNTFHDDAFERLAGLSSLRVLRLAHTRLTYFSKPRFASFPALEKLVLNGTEVGGGTSVWQLPDGLRQLELTESGTTDADLRAFAALVSLESLELTGCPITDRGLVALGNLRSLKRLSLDDTRVEGPGLSAIADLPALEDLSIRGIPVSDDDMATLSRLASLEALTLSSPRLTAAGVARLARLENLRHLTISTRGLSDLNWAEMLPRLTFLDRYELGESGADFDFGF